jgi:hypothetical protein
VASEKIHSVLFKSGIKTLKILYLMPPEREERAYSGRPSFSFSDQIIYRSIS